MDTLNSTALHVGAPKVLSWVPTLLKSPSNTKKAETHTMNTQAPIKKIKHYRPDKSREPRRHPSQTPGGNHNSNLTFPPQFYCVWMWILKQYIIHYSSLKCFTHTAATCFCSPNIIFVGFMHPILHHNLFILQLMARTLGLPAIRVHRNDVTVNPGVCVLCANVWHMHWNLCSGAELSPFWRGRSLLLQHPTKQFSMEVVLLKNILSRRVIILLLSTNPSGRVTRLHRKHTHHLSIFC